MQSFSEISKNTQPKSYTVSLTEYPWEFQNNALWGTPNMPNFMIKITGTGGN